MAEIAIQRNRAFYSDENFPAGQILVNVQPSNLQHVSIARHEFVEHRINKES